MVKELFEINFPSLCNRIKQVCWKLERNLHRESVFYIGGSDVLPPPLEPCEETQILQEYAE